VEESILISTKKILGLAEDYTVFDLDVLTHINAAFFILHQLGVGPDEGFLVEGPDETWSEFALIDGSQNSINLIKTYVYLKVRFLFDIPQTSFLVTAMENQIKEYEWRLNVAREYVLPEEERVP
jgi:hypothetical protein